MAGLYQQPIPTDLDMMGNELIDMSLEKLELIPETVTEGRLISVNGKMYYGGYVDSELKWIEYLSDISIEGINERFDEVNAKFGEVQDTFLDVENKIEERVPKSPQAIQGSFFKVTTNADGLVIDGDFNLSREDLPIETQFVYEYSIVGDGNTKSWTFPIGSDVPKPCLISIRDSDGYEVAFTIRYTTTKITLSTYSPPPTGTVYSVKVLANNR